MEKLIFLFRVDGYYLSTLFYFIKIVVNKPLQILCCENKKVLMLSKRTFNNSLHHMCAANTPLF